jgi:CRISPR-associated protein Cas1
VLNARLPQRTAFLVGQNSGDVQRRLTQYQYALNHPFCLQMATRLVMLKVTRQRAVLQQALSTRPELSLILTRAIKLLDRSLITLTDTTLDSLTVLNGIEGAAAKAYFQGYTALFADSLHFSARNRRPPKDPVNAILSLSYTLVHHEAVNVLKMYGLDSALGFYHQPFYGRQSLACDVIEPLRPYLDRWIWRLFAQQTLRVDHFINDEQACFLNQAGKPIFYKAFFANIKPLKRLLRYYARHIVNAINQQA